MKCVLYIFFYRCAIISKLLVLLRVSFAKIEINSDHGNFYSCFTATILEATKSLNFLDGDESCVSKIKNLEKQNKENIPLVCAALRKNVEKSMAFYSYKATEIKNVLKVCVKIS